MAVRQILEYPRHRRELRSRSVPIKQIDLPAVRLIQDLLDTLMAHPQGIGLAAPQSNSHRRVVAVRLLERPQQGQTPAPAIALVNPVIINSSEPRRDFDGCLSFPGLFGETVRPHFLEVRGLDALGCPFERAFQGFNAVLVHHEIDHLDGVLFIDRIEHPDDLYRVRQEEDSSLVRVPITPNLKRELRL